MTKTEALNILELIAGAFEQSWKPSRAAISVYVEILAVPELDYDITRKVVMGMLHTPQRFAPTSGMIYSEAAQLTAKRQAEREEKLGWELAGAIVSEAPEIEGCIDDRAAVERLEKHPEFKNIQHNLRLQSWQLIATTMHRLGKKRKVTKAAARFGEIINGLKAAWDDGNHKVA